MDKPILIFLSFAILPTILFISFFLALRWQTNCQKEYVLAIIDKYARLKMEDFLGLWTKECGYFPRPSQEKLKRILISYQNCNRIGYDKRRDEYTSNKIRMLFYGRK